MLMAEGPKMERKWRFRMWLGLVTESQDVSLGTQEGAVRAWTVRRRRSVVTRQLCFRCGPARGSPLQSEGETTYASA